MKCDVLKITGNVMKENKAINGKQQSGQSIVLITFMIIGLLAFVGIAVDVGFVYARRSQLSKAVDAAALAAVTEVESVSFLDNANFRAGQFLKANLPVAIEYNSGTPPADPPVIYYQSSAAEGDLGEYEYTITATWPVELYFLKVIGWQMTPIAGSATAAYFPVTDIYASRRVEDGALSTSNQAVFGFYQKSQLGDPFSPEQPDWAAWELDTNDPYQGQYTYEYRILIPKDYPSNIVRVELFDPDSINRLNSDDTDGNDSRYTASVVHTDAWTGDEIESLYCTSYDINPCLINTNEDTLGLPLDQVNLWWFVRIDENRQYGGAPSGKTYTPQYNTRTVYRLFYYARHDDGTIEPITLAQYIGQTGDGARDNGDHDTDMRWVSPGAPQSFDQPVFVPAGPEGTVRSFEINLDNDVTNILTDPATGNRYLYLDVTAIDGYSENGFEIWAGPPDYVNTIPSDVNMRNVRVINDPGSHSSQGVTIFGLSNLPMNSNYRNVVDIPLIYVPSEYAGGTILVSLFDPDSGAKPPIAFYFDSVAFTPDNSANLYDESGTDWAMAFDVSGVTDPDQGYWWPDRDVGDRCTIGSCQNLWVDPPFAIRIPTLDPDACTADPSDQDVCTPFLGGRLVARYQGGQDDTYGWMIRLKGLPFLVR